MGGVGGGGGCRITYCRVLWIGRSLVNRGLLSSRNQGCLTSSCKRGSESRNMVSSVVVATEGGSSTSNLLLSY